MKLTSLAQSFSKNRPTADDSHLESEEHGGSDALKSECPLSISSVAVSAIKLDFTVAERSKGELFNKVLFAKNAGATPLNLDFLSIMLVENRAEEAKYNSPR